MITSFTLGWRVAELYHFGRIPGEAEPDKLDSLPGLGRLPQKDRAHLLATQIEVALEQLGQKDLAQPEVAQQVQADQINVAALKQVVRTLHELLLKSLTARDATLGKAYGLGRALAETMLVPSTDDPRSFSHQFNIYRIGTLQADLADLKSGLPRHSADAVAHNLEAWSTWIAAQKLDAAGVQWTTDQKRHIGQSIRRQGEIWYGLLTGEIDSLQLLRPTDYVTATESLLARIGELGWSFLTTNWIGRVLGLIAIGVAVLLVVVSLTGHLAAVAGAAILLLGALGITAGGVASSVKQVLRQAQAPLWEAELTNGVATAALRLPNSRRIETVRQLGG